MHTAITIDALKVLDAIDRKGSFAGAAGELFRVPSAISYTVQKLEEDLNVSIFDRTGHKAVLTPAGRYLLEEGRSLLEAAENLAHTTRQVAQGWETRLRIGFNSLLPADCLFSAIEEFQQLGVPVDVQIVEEVFAGAWDALQSRRVDMIVGADQLSKPAGSFATLALGDVSFVFAVAADHALANASDPLTEADIVQFPATVAADTSRSLPPGHAGIFRQQRTLTVSNIDQKIAAQEAGLGVGWLPRPRIQEQLKHGTLIAKEVHEPRSPISIHLARHSEDQGKALMWFWSRLSEDQSIRNWLQPEPA
ncbi:MAG: transcriptional regulator, LysR family [Marinobacter excellens HL-55]|uniref:Transcriptional regulator, LysR family n=1 Tax=Marinobacter excellens HL-55 TaxID=1305731 RepID=A0A0P8BEV2_9GAMM|nr:MAG: transcriptional regulator, LysR family [Marinobacter excellens HL-55]